MVSEIVLQHVLLEVKDKVEFWSCDCIVKEKVWNGSEKVDHVACKYFGVYCKVLESLKS